MADREERQEGKLHESGDTESPEESARNALGEQLMGSGVTFGK